VGETVITKRYRCPECEGIFKYDHHPSIEADPLPEDAACPHCGFASEAEYPAAVVSPAIRRPIAANVDNMIRGMEDGAQHRANIAMEQYGLSTEEANQMKITNLKDAREGEIAAMPVNNAVTAAIDSNPQAYGFQGGAAQGAALSPYVQAGPFPNAGLAAMNQIRQEHSALVQRSGHQAVVSTSSPALETQQPGYRRRA
jgi:DNA-directed RNA polymerase subunit RPC12/RpoP